MDPSVADRASRITPQEWRVIALAIEGVAPTAACEALGIAVGTLESHKQAIRRKLGVPKGIRFEAFVRENFAAGVAIPDAKPAPPPREVEAKNRDRRVRWLLRITLQEIQEVGASAGLRAQLLQQTASRMGSSDSEEARREVDELERICAEMKDVFKRTLDGIRARGTDPHLGA